MLLYQSPLSLVIGAALVQAAASPSSIGSSLTILSHNDLYNVQTSRDSAAILLHQFFSYDVAQQACLSLHEGLWNSQSHNFSAGLGDALTYQIYLKTFDTSQSFWVLNLEENSSACNAINAQGKVHSFNCTEVLPALCSQSAPIENATLQDKVTRFRVSQTLGSGTLTGYRDRYAWHFLGVRFAPQPPRLGYAAVHNNTGDHFALDYGAQCVQVSSEGVNGSEDCLFLNVWTPFLPQLPARQTELKPVMVWIFGGGFTEGSANDPSNDGTSIASRGDVVLVEMNYRLGNLGWLALTDGVTNGNYGLQDVVTSLRWVQQSIQSFGGDPERVTIWGESAGAAAVRAILASPQASGLLAGAIMESSPGLLSSNTPHVKYQAIQDEYTAVGEAVLNQTRCLNSKDQVKCLRSLNATALAQTSAVALYPVIDGVYLNSSGLVLNNSGYASPVPIMLGNNRDELAITLSSLAPYISFENISTALVDLGALIGVDYSKVVASGLFSPAVGANDSDAVFNATQRVLTDGGILCFSEATAHAGRKNGIFPSVYYFQFNRTYQPATFNSPYCSPPSTAQYPFGDPSMEYFKCHAGEVSYTLGTLAYNSIPDRDGYDTPFSQVIVDQWAAFAWTGNPNPDAQYLKARGYANTTEFVNVAGQWQAVGSHASQQERVLQWADMVPTIPWVDLPQCKVLGQGISLLV